ncbi:mitochondrial protein required for respiration [Coniophora puteana RWD-64-598 SS2]|uniref:SURF1-like protein n=1 Tax=Coniophora puteana (strain RWD-64-598) TaxID=741705 RepID=A0A5M3N6J6_CONPW|nr:mitochondrial protein required for respiration [Coniophora puteana RWD-64-598 SS2]EIW87059.1 mitochondrial protein required for respiration [Coniophora puteana RWD-64-598 SS2]
MLSALRSFTSRHRPVASAFKRVSRPRLPTARAFATEAAEAGGQNLYKPKKDSLLSPTIWLLGFLPVFAFGLGTWQVQRLQWKINLIDELEEKLHREPILLPRHVNLSAVPDFIYRRVLLKGKWDHKHSLLLGPRVREGAHGHHVVTPLVRSDGSTILVDRGFITNEHADDYVRGEDAEVEVVGMLRTSHVRNRFTPDNDPQGGHWYWADVDAMANYAGGEGANVQPVYVEQIADYNDGEALSRISRGVPVGRSATVDVRNAHLSYVITWYSLSAFTAVMLARLVTKRRAQHRIRPLPR